MMEVINNIGLNLSGSGATWLFSVAAKTTTLLLAAWLVSRALTAYAPRVRYLVWSSAILCALALPPASAIVTQVQIPSPAPAPQTVVQQTSKSSPVGAIIGAVVVILLIVVIFVIVSNNDSSDDTPTPGTGGTPAVTEPAAPAPESTDGG